MAYSTSIPQTPPARPGVLDMREGPQEAFQVDSIIRMLRQRQEQAIPTYDILITRAQARTIERDPRFPTGVESLYGLRVMIEDRPGIA